MSCSATLQTECWRSLPYGGDMGADVPEVRLVGFEEHAQLGDLLAEFRMMQDYRAMLPDHLHEILRKQRADVVIESIELLDAPQCALGGMQEEAGKPVVRVRTLEVPLQLRVRLRAGSGRYELDIRLVLKGEGLDSDPKTTSDMFIASQRTIP